MEITQQQLDNACENGLVSFGKWLVTKGIISPFCPECDREMRVVMGGAHFKLDGICFNCLHCNTESSIRHHTIWEHKQISVLQCLRVFVCFQSGSSIADVARQWEIGDDSVSNLYFLFKTKIREHMSNPYVKQMTKFVKTKEFQIYEIDESILLNVKKDQDVIESQWIFGILERDTGKCFLKRIPDRTATALVQLVTEHVPTGSIVITDSLTSYINLSDNYYHYTVNHSKKDYQHTDWLPGHHHRFLVTTNWIETNWHGVKGRLSHHSHHTPSEIDMVLDQITFIHNKFSLLDLLKPNL